MTPQRERHLSHIYGQFIEHIGDLVNRSIWAEMIDDRKSGPGVTASTGLNRNEVQVTETVVPLANTLEIAPASSNMYEFEKQ